MLPAMPFTAPFIGAFVHECLVVIVISLLILISLWSVVRQGSIRTACFMLGLRLTRFAAHLLRTLLPHAILGSFADTTSAYWPCLAYGWAYAICCLVCILLKW